MFRAPHIFARSIRSFPWLGETWMFGRPASALAFRADASASSGWTRRSVRYWSTAVHCSCWLMIAPYYAKQGKIASIYRSMKAAWFIVLVSLLLAGCQQDPPVQQKQPPTASVKSERTTDSFFRDELSRSGEWIDLPGYGASWYPSHVPPGWKPYVRGRWVWTDGVGWLWVGSERWSWACDHYGRWMFADSHGWVWVPGKQWSPAWVAMRSGPDYIGWAPLPPAGKGVAELDVSKLQ